MVLAGFSCMIIRFKQWLQSPTYEQESMTWLSRFLNTILITNLITITIFIIVLPLLGMTNIGQIGILSTGIFASLVLKIILNRKLLKQTIHLFIFFAWIVVTISPLSDTGVYSPSMASFVIVILLSTIFSSRYAALYATSASIITSLGILILMKMGIVSTVPNHPLPAEIAFMAYSVTFTIVGTITYLSSNFLNLSIQRLQQAQQQSLETTSYLKRAEELAHLGNFEFDLATQQITWSDEVYRIFGISQSTVITLDTYRELMSLDMYNHVMAKVQETIETGQPYEIEHPILLHDGAQKEVYAIGNPVTDDTGKVVKIFGIIQDITARKHAEQIQQVLLNISRARYDDKSFKDLLDYIIQQLGTLINVQNCYIALYDENTGIYSFPYGTDEYDSDWSSARLDNTLTDHVRRTQTAQLITEKQHLHLTATTQLKFVGTWSKVWLGAPLKIQQYTIGVIAIQDYDDVNAYQQSDLNLLAYVADNIASIIESKRSEEEHLALELQMRKNDFLKEFIGHMTHDIKTPLSVIKNSTYLMEHIQEPARQTEYIGRINYQLERLDRIIEDILTISRLDHIDLSSQQSIRLTQLIKHIANQLQPKIERKSITFILDVAPQIPVFMGNESDLTRALLNLIENATHYTENGGQITVSCHHDDVHITIIIQDNGIGITSDDLPHVFERFYRADNARDFENGTGLGLAIVKRVVELHHGTITVSSQLDIGTTFTIQFIISDLTPKPSTQPTRKEA